MNLTTCTETGCNASFYLVPARGEVANLCIDHGQEYMRANGHQNDTDYIAS